MNNRQKYLIAREVLRELGGDAESDLRRLEAAFRLGTHSLPEILADIFQRNPACQERAAHYERVRRCDRCERRIAQARNHVHECPEAETAIAEAEQRLAAIGDIPFESQVSELEAAVDRVSSYWQRQQPGTRPPDGPASSPIALLPKPPAAPSIAGASEENPMNHDTITVLHTERRLAKLWQVNGEITNYDLAKVFTHKEHPVANIDDLSGLLFRLERDSHACIIRGRYRGDEAAQIDPEAVDLKRGQVLRRKSAFEDQPLHSVLIDVDDFELVGSDPVMDPVGAIAEYIATLPEPFRNASYHWQLSNSAGHPRKRGKLNAHLWFWLATPRTSAELKTWAKAVKLPIDRSVLAEVQIHYTAAPVFEQGLTDPVRTRSGFVRAERDEVELEIAEVPVRESKPTTHIVSGDLKALRAKVAKLNVPDKSEPFDYQGFYFPIAAAIHSASGGAEEGLTIAELELEARYPHPTGPDWLRTQIWPYLDADREGGITVATLDRMLQEQADPTDGFTDVVLTPEEESRQEEIRRENERKNLRIDYTDSGNASLLEKLTKGNLRYVAETKLWLSWDGARWLEDRNEVLVRKQALRVAEYYRADGRSLTIKATAATGKARELLEKLAAHSYKWAKTCRDRRRLDNIIYEFSKREAVLIAPQMLNRTPWLLGVENGVVDLQTGELRAAARDEFVTKRCTVRYDPLAEAPRWERLIVEISGTPIAAELDETGGVNPSTVGRYTPRPALAGYLHRMLGYSITGSVREQKMFIAHGGGSNGKNVLTDTLKDVLGSYHCTLTAGVVLASQRGLDPERATSSLVSLLGARFAVLSETKDGDKLDGSLVKLHTGETQISGRELYQRKVTFPVTHKFWLSTNNKPDLDTLDDAARGRLHLIPFHRKWNRPGEVTHDPALPDGDKDLLATLRAEYEGVLAWLVRGAVTYYRDGLDAPEEVKAETRDYFNQQNTVLKWIEAATNRTEDAAGGSLARELFTAYRQWCRNNEVRAVSEPLFGRELRSQKVPFKKAETGNFWGLRASVHSYSLGAAPPEAEFTDVEDLSPRTYTPEQIATGEDLV